MVCHRRQNVDTEKGSPERAVKTVNRFASFRRVVFHDLFSFHAFFSCIFCFINGICDLFIIFMQFND